MVVEQIVLTLRMLRFELERERSLTDFTLKGAPLICPDFGCLRLLHLSLNPVTQAIQMDEFDSTRARATLKQWVFLDVSRVPTKAAVDLFFIVVVLTSWLLLGLFSVQRVRF